MTESMAEVNKYQNGKIYKIVSYSHPELVYYGSTINVLSKRMGTHRGTRNLCTSKQIIAVGDAHILLVENFPCNSKEELNKKEGEYILNNDCVNKIIAGRTFTEYREQNKEQISKKDQEYREINKEKIIKRHQEYNERNREIISRKWTEYVQQNREKINQKNKLYYETNSKIQYVCVCGNTVTRANKTHHEKTKKHIQFNQSQTETSEI